LPVSRPDASGDQIVVPSPISEYSLPYSLFMCCIVLHERVAFVMVCVCVCVVFALRAGRRAQGGAYFSTRVRWSMLYWGCSMIGGMRFNRCAMW
jgi:hypothetical protein